MKLTQQKLEGWGYLIYVWWKFHNPTSTVFGWSTRVTDRRTEKLAGDSIARFYAMLSRAKNRNRQTLGLLYVVSGELKTLGPVPTCDVTSSDVTCWYDNTERSPS